MPEPLFTCACLTLAIGGLFFFGLPASAFLLRKVEPELTWALAPVLGIALIVLPLQNLVYADVRLAVGTRWLWLAACVAWLLCLRHREKREFMRRAPLDLIGVGALSVLIQGVGITSLGARGYIGRAWFDQFNYVATTQFLMDRPFSTTFETVSGQPYLLKAIAAAHDRIGQSVLQGFLASSLGADAKALFEPTILLLPFLTVIVIFSLGRSLGLDRSKALLAGGAASLLPAISYLHLECFQSQALATPLLLVIPLLLQFVSGVDRSRGVVAAALVVAACLSIYTEYALLVLAEIVVAALGALTVRAGAEVQRGGRSIDAHISFSWDRHSLIEAAMIGVVPLVAVLMNVGYAHGIPEIVGRSVTQGQSMKTLYPWALSAEGIGRIWFGDFAGAESHAKWVLTPLALVLSGVGYAGLAVCAIRGRAVGVTALVLALSPWPLSIGGELFSYQFYKLLLATSPLLLLGVVGTLTWDSSRRAEAGSKGVWAGRLKVSGLAAVTAVCASSSAAMGYRAGFGRSAEDIANRGGAFELLAPATRKTYALLEQSRGEQIVLNFRDGLFPGCYLQGWFAYAARRSDVRLEGDRCISDMDVEQIPAKQSALRSNFYLVTTQPVAGGGARSLVQGQEFSVFRVQGSWAFIDRIRNPNGVEKSEDGRPLVWVGNGATELVVLASEQGVARISAAALPGPSLPESPTRRISVASGQYVKEFVIAQPSQRYEIDVPIEAGAHPISIWSLDRATVTKAGNGDTRTLLLMLSGLLLTDFHSDDNTKWAERNGWTTMGHDGGSSKSN